MKRDDALRIVVGIMHDDSKEWKCGLLADQIVAAFEAGRLVGRQEATNPQPKAMGAAEAEAMRLFQEDIARDLRTNLKEIINERIAETTNKIV